MPDNNKNTIMLIVLATVAMSLGVWFGLDLKPAGQAQRDYEKIQGTLLLQPKALPNFSLIDNKNKVFTRDNLKNTWSVLFFGYTHCPDVCPATLQIMRRVHGELNKMQVRPPQTVLVSVDPKRDTPEVLDKYVAYFGKDFIGVSGKLSELHKLAGALGVYYKKTPGASGDIEADDYAMDHTSAMIVVNPKGEAAALLSPPFNAGQIIRDLKTIVQQQKQ